MIEGNSYIAIKTIAKIKFATLSLYEYTHIACSWKKYGIPNTHRCVCIEQLFTFTVARKFEKNQDYD